MLDFHMNESFGYLYHPFNWTMHCCLHIWLLIPFFSRIDHKFVAHIDLRALTKHIHDLPHVMLKIMHDLTMLLLWSLSHIAMKSLWYHMWTSIIFCDQPLWHYDNLIYNLHLHNPLDIILNHLDKVISYS